MTARYRDNELEDGHQDDEARWSAWMARALEGDREAYAKLMSDLGRASESFLRWRFGSAGGSDFVEECVQEALLAVHRARHTYNPRRPLRPWFFTIVRHKAIDLLRRQRVRRTDDSMPGEDVEAVGVPALEPFRQLDAARLLDGLEAKYREALFLTKFDGYTIQEAADRAGISATAMKTRVHRAVRAVQKRLRTEDLS
jgi:RNA polymerase sigma-70 factor (ECF subfamily)